MSVGIVSYFGFNKTPEVVSGSYLLDLYPSAAGAFSLRRLSSTYTGSAIKIRRTSDDTESDIGFSGEALDTTAISSFVGTYSAFVTTWYDQSGNGLNVVQATASNQPRIVDAGTLDTGGTKPSLRFLTSMWLDGGDILDIPGKTYSGFVTGQISSINVGTLYAKSLLGAAANRYAIVRDSTSYTRSILHTSTTNAPLNLPDDTVRKLYQSRYLNNYHNFIFNGTIKGTASVSSALTGSTYNFLVGTYNSNTGGVRSSQYDLDGRIQEIVIWFNAPDDASITTNMMTYWELP